MCQLNLAWLSLNSGWLTVAGGGVVLFAPTTLRRDDVAALRSILATMACSQTRCLSESGVRQQRVSDLRGATQVRCRNAPASHSVQLWNARTAKRSELRPLRRLILILHAVIVTGNVCRLFRVRHLQVRIPQYTHGESDASASSRNALAARRRS